MRAQKERDPAQRLIKTICAWGQTIGAVQAGSVVGLGAWLEPHERDMRPWRTLPGLVRTVKGILANTPVGSATRTLIARINKL